jgi:hypothetical protein
MYLYLELHFALRNLWGCKQKNLTQGIWTVKKYLFSLAMMSLVIKAINLQNALNYSHSGHGSFNFENFGENKALFN